MNKRYICSIIMLFLGVFVLFVGSKDIRNYYGTKGSDWIDKNALIAKVEEQNLVTKEFSFRAKGVKRVRKVLISYAVDGREYLLKLDKFVSGMKAGKEITIAYNPSSPEEYVYKPALSEYIGAMVAGVFCVFMGIYMIVRTRRE